METIMFVFLVSGIVRFLVMLIFLPGIQEVRKTEEPPLMLSELTNIDKIEQGVSDVVSGFQKTKSNLLSNSLRKELRLFR